MNRCKGPVLVGCGQEQVPYVVLERLRRPEVQTGWSSAPFSIPRKKVALWAESHARPLDHRDVKTLTALIY